MENDSLPQYMQIALSVAGRIAGGDVPEGAKISGRSKLSSEYNVSPETIRKAVRLLSDMRVVDVREKSGVYVLSADNARRYLHNAGAKIDVFAKRQQMKELLEQQEILQWEQHEAAMRSIGEATGFPGTGGRYPAQLCLPHSEELERHRQKSQQSSFLAGDRRDDRRHPARYLPYRVPRPRRGAVRRRRGHFCRHGRRAGSSFPLLPQHRIKAGASAGQERSTQNEP